MTTQVYKLQSVISKVLKNEFIPVTPFKYICFLKILAGTWLRFVWPWIISKLRGFIFVE